MLTHEEVLGLSYRVNGITFTVDKETVPHPLGFGESYHVVGNDGVRVEDFFVPATDKSRKYLTDEIESGYFVRVTEDDDAR